MRVLPTPPPRNWPPAGIVGADGRHSAVTDRLWWVTSDAPAGIEPGAVTDWLASRVPVVTPPLDFAPIAGGHSNLTYTVTDADGRRWVLRRPPLGQVLATAHDMAREHRIISALASTDVPVAPVVGLCEDPVVNGAPFYVMDFVDGLVVRDPLTASGLDPAVRRRAGESLIEVLARIHAVEPAAVGLDDLGRHEGYIERQLKRWHGQLEASKTRELPVMDQVHAVLCAAVPPQGPATIVHGDYRLDNCMLATDGSVLAVLDWELCTLGDPLADLGLLCVYWSDPGDADNLAVSGATAVGEFPTRDELIARYGDLTGRDTSQIAFYIAFGYWKLACIVEGVYSRYTGGAMGTQGQDYSAFADVVTGLAEAALDATGSLTT
jgi:aminoglycoside phosphotransferase (APT) family kinase protein